MAASQANPVRRAYVGLGSNLSQPAQQIERALSVLAETPGIELRSRSRLYRSAAMLWPGQAPQPDYCNAVCELVTALGADALLDRLQALESAAGRVRTERWGARVLDLDLLHIEGERCATPRLQLPHPGLAQRAFVLIPLAEIAPGLHIETLGDIADLAAAVDSATLRDWV